MCQHCLIDQTPTPGIKPLRAWRPGFHSTGAKCCGHLAGRLLLDWLVQFSCGLAGQPGLPGAGLTRVLHGSCRSELPALQQAPEHVPAGLSFHPQPAWGCPGHQVTKGGRTAGEEPSEGSSQLCRLGGQSKSTFRPR